MNNIKITNEKGVKNILSFVKFLQKRFTDESDRITSYFEEWADSFPGEEFTIIDKIEGGDEK